MKTHLVKQGECLSSIAHAYGLADWRLIYEDPSKAEFRQKRPDPNVIYPGDELQIPDRGLREERCQTDQRHRFKVAQRPTYLNVCLEDQVEGPIRNAPYHLVVDGLEFDARTDGEGWVRHQIPPNAERGVLIIWPNPSDKGHTIRWELRLGHLDPIETTPGIKGRLKNLGYDPGEVDEAEGDEYRAAVRQFQKDHGLPEDGIVGDGTRERLRQKHRL